MSHTLTQQLKTARGKRYYDILKQVIAARGDDIVRDARAAIAANDGKLTAVDVGVLAVRYDLNLKATWEWLEECRVLPTGTYDKAVSRGMRAKQVLQSAQQIVPLDA